jgi:hypothetical protein
VSNVIPGRVLAREPGIHKPRGGCAGSQLQDLWLWIPGSARYASGPGMTDETPYRASNSARAMALHSSGNGPDAAGRCARRYQ